MNKTKNEVYYLLPPETAEECIEKFEHIHPEAKILKVHSYENIAEIQGALIQDLQKMLLEDSSTWCVRDSLCRIMQYISAKKYTIFFCRKTFLLQKNEGEDLHKILLELLMLSEKI